MRSTLGSLVAWAAVLVAILNYASQATTLPLDDGTTPQAISPRATTPWQAKHRIISADYQDSFGETVCKGYRLAYVSGYTIDNDPRFAAIWDKSITSSWVGRHGMASAEYQNQFNAFVSKGFRPVLVNGYAVRGNPRFVAIWDKNGNAPYVARHDLVPSQYQAEFETLSCKGYRLKHVSGYSRQNQALYAAIWEKSGLNVAWAAHHGMTSSVYQQMSDKYLGQGYRTVHVNGYVVNNVDYYAAIWDRSPGGPWVARHGMSSADYQAEFNKWVGQGYSLKLVSGYTLNSNQDIYAAIWVKG